MPDRSWGATWHRVLFLGASVLFAFILIFLLFVEFFFFEEFKSRYNTVAVDYLIYPQEVFVNIWESYHVGIVLIVCLAFIGMVDALYLSIKRNAGPVPCHVTRGCTDVLTSKYSEIAGVPLSAIGLAFYLTILSLAVFKIFEDPSQPLYFPVAAVFYLSGAALVVSALLVGVQAFILKAFCEYCLLSAALVLTIFLLSPSPVRHKPAQ